MKRETTYTPDNVLFIVLMCVFTASVVLVLMQGVRIYRSAVVSSELLYNERTCAFYITEKLRHGDEMNAVYVDSFDGLNALYIDSRYNDTVYSTIMYFNEGWLNELFCEKGANFNRADGTKIIRADSVTFLESSPGLLYVETVDGSGNSGGLYFRLRSGG